ncbi:MAG: indolepyruvate oxidoreductase subunit beta [Bacillota bacterium]|nr:indolepyruvate oxidoreductase subunit beta [Bacillota bacterium]
MSIDILIAGVGGQGTVLASRLLAAAAIDEGYFVRTSETIGMAQRGGCVVSHIRIDSKEASPVIPWGKADILIGFEPSEAARNIYRLSEEGSCIVNTKEIKPVTASLGTVSYDIDAVNKYISANSKKAVFIDGYSLAQKAGSVKALNIVLLGATAAESLLPFGKSSIEKAIKDNVNPKFMDMNIKAFNYGFDYIKSICK